MPEDGVTNAGYDGGAMVRFGSTVDPTEASAPSAGYTSVTESCMH